MVHVELFCDVKALPTVIRPAIVGFRGYLGINMDVFGDGNIVECGLRP
jgi:hypothetical protein